MNSSGKATEGQISCNLLKLAEQVAGSGEVINIAEMVEVERGCNGNLRSLLAMPIRNRHAEIIGKQVHPLSISPHTNSTQTLE